MIPLSLNNFRYTCITVMLNVFKLLSYKLISEMCIQIAVKVGDCWYNSELHGGKTQ